MFAVTYGSFDFMKQGSGLLCVYSLKNPSFPEYIFQTDSGVMCCDFHPEHSNLLAVGLYDGTVLVYDTPSKRATPIYRSTVKNGKHTDPVWQVSSWNAPPLTRTAGHATYLVNRACLGFLGRGRARKAPFVLQRVIGRPRHDVDAVEVDAGAPGCP